MAVVALVSELMMQSQIAAAAARAGATVDLVGSVEALVAKAEAKRPLLVILDLSHPGLDPRTLVQRLKQVLPAEATVLAFGPHVHKERLAAAEEAGCERVISRGQFHAQVDEILKERAG